MEDSSSVVSVPSVDMQLSIAANAVNFASSVQSQPNQILLQSNRPLFDGTMKNVVHLVSAAEPVAQVDSSQHLVQAVQSTLGLSPVAFATVPASAAVGVPNSCARQQLSIKQQSQLSQANLNSVRLPTSSSLSKPPIVVHIVSRPPVNQSVHPNTVGNDVAGTLACFQRASVPIHHEALSVAFSPAANYLVSAPVEVNALHSSANAQSVTSLTQPVMPFQLHMSHPVSNQPAVMTGNTNPRVALAGSAATSNSAGGLIRLVRSIQDAQLAHNTSPLVLNAGSDNNQITSYQAESAVVFDSYPCSRKKLNSQTAVKAPTMETVMTRLPNNQVMPFSEVSTVILPDPAVLQAGVPTPSVVENLSSTDSYVAEVKPPAGISPAPACYVTVASTRTTSLHTQLVQLQASQQAGLAVQSPIGYVLPRSVNCTTVASGALPTINSSSSNTVNIGTVQNVQSLAGSLPSQIRKPGTNVVAGNFTLSPTVLSQIFRMPRVALPPQRHPVLPIEQLNVLINGQVLSSPLQSVPQDGASATNQQITESVPPAACLNSQSFHIPSVGSIGSGNDRYIMGVSGPKPRGRGGRVTKKTVKKAVPLQQDMCKLPVAHSLMVTSTTPCRASSLGEIQQHFSTAANVIVNVATANTQQQQNLQQVMGMNHCVPSSSLNEIVCQQPSTFTSLPTVNKNVLTSPTTSTIGYPVFSTNAAVRAVQGRLINQAGSRSVFTVRPRLPAPSAASRPDTATRPLVAGVKRKCVFGKRYCVNVNEKKMVVYYNGKYFQRKKPTEEFMPEADTVQSEAVATMVTTSSNDHQPVSTLISDPAPVTPKQVYYCARCSLVGQHTKCLKCSATMLPFKPMLIKPVPMPCQQQRQSTNTKTYVTKRNTRGKTVPVKKKLEPEVVQILSSDEDNDSEDGNHSTKAANDDKSTPCLNVTAIKSDALKPGSTTENQTTSVVTPQCGATSGSPAPFNLRVRFVRIGTVQINRVTDCMFFSQAIRLSFVKEGSSGITHLPLAVSDIKTVRIHFGPSGPVIFLLMTTDFGKKIRGLLGMFGCNSGVNYDPGAQVDAIKYVLIVPQQSTVTELDFKPIISHMQSQPTATFTYESLLPNTASSLLVSIMEATRPTTTAIAMTTSTDTVSTNSANTSQVQTVSCIPVPLSLPSSKPPTVFLTTSNQVKLILTPIAFAPIAAGDEDEEIADRSRTPSPFHSIFSATVVRLFLYPPPPATGGITVTNEDFYCLNDGEFLNDVIIDFYLKYLQLEILSAEDRKRTHIFSSFFYRRLTQKQAHGCTNEETAGLSLSKRRHLRVKTWTRHVDLFAKDFIVVPINECAHWYLAIICFPGLTEPVAMDTVESVTNNADITKVVGKEAIQKSTPVKQACILVFDSLMTVPQHTGVVRTLREYMQEEWNARKLETCSSRAFTKDNFKGTTVHCPQQTNFSDCGVFVLQYVESFFKMPIQNYSFPFQSLTKWFTEELILAKRGSLRQLVLDLQHQLNPDLQYDPLKDGIQISASSMQDISEPMDTDSASTAALVAEEEEPSGQVADNERALSSETAASGEPETTGVVEPLPDKMAEPDVAVSPSPIGCTVEDAMMQVQTQFEQAETQFESVDTQAKQAETQSDQAETQFDAKVDDDNGPTVDQKTSSTCCANLSTDMNISDKPDLPDTSCQDATTDTVPQLSPVPLSVAPLQFPETLESSTTCSFGLQTNSTSLPAESLIVQSGTAAAAVLTDDTASAPLLSSTEGNTDLPVQTRHCTDQFPPRNSQVEVYQIQGTNLTPAYTSGTGLLHQVPHVRVPGSVTSVGAQFNQPYVINDPNSSNPLMLALKQFLVCRTTSSDLPGITVSVPATAGSAATNSLNQPPVFLTLPVGIPVELLANLPKTNNTSAACHMSSSASAVPVVSAAGHSVNTTLTAVRPAVLAVNSVQSAFETPVVGNKTDNSKLSHSAALSNSCPPTECDNEEHVTVLQNVSCACDKGDSIAVEICNADVIAQTLNNNPDSCSAAASSTVLSTTKS